MLKSKHTYLVLVQGLIENGVKKIAAMGLFFLQGNVSAVPIYEITSPVFDKVSIELDPKYYSGKQFNIITHNSARENRYIQKANLNSKPMDCFWFTHEEYARGGMLEIWLGAEPNKAWGLCDPPRRVDAMKKLK